VTKSRLTHQTTEHYAAALAEGPTNTNLDFTTMPDEQLIKAAVRHRKQLYMVFMTPIEALGDPIAAFGEFLRPHIAFLHQLEQSGKIFASGALTDEDGEWRGSGLMILRATSHEDARDIVELEPLHQAGLRKHTVRGFSMEQGRISLSVNNMDGSFTIG
jgi:uncharacterized protein YciI